MELIKHYINGNDEEYPISTFSCRGPTQCPGDGSLSMRSGTVETYNLSWT